MSVRITYTPEGGIVIRCPGGPDQAVKWCNQELGMEYGFLERTRRPTYYRLRSLVFNDGKDLIFVDSKFLCPLIQNRTIPIREQVNRALSLHASKLDLLNDPARHEDFTCGQAALANAYYFINYTALRWEDGRYEDECLYQRIHWLHVIDEFINSIVARHGADFPTMEEKLRSRHFEFLEMMKTEFGIATDEIPAKAAKMTLMGREQYEEALSRYEWDDYEM